MDETDEYCVKDMSLAEQGLLNIEYAESQIYGASEEFCRGMCSWYLGEDPNLDGYNQCLDTCSSA